MVFLEVASLYRQDQYGAVAWQPLVSWFWWLEDQPAPASGHWSLVVARLSSSVIMTTSTTTSLWKYILNGSSQTLRYDVNFNIDFE